MNLPYPISKGAEPVFISGNNVGVLLLHGFTASPYEMKFLGEFLNKNGGYTISVPLLAGHGRDTKTLNSVHWNDWVKSASDAYEKLKLTCTKIIVVGMSMGGSIALSFATKFPIDGLICMGTPLYITKVSGLARILYPFLKSVKKKGGPDIADENQKNSLVSLKTIPLHALIEFRKFLKTLPNDLKKVKCPLYLMHSVNDHTIEYQNMELIKNMVSSDNIKTMTFEKSFHILPLDLEKDKLNSECLEFINTLM